MSATAATDVTDTASSSQAESSSTVHASAAVGDGTATAAAADGPRRGSRARKPTSRAAGLDPTEAPSVSQTVAQQTATRSGRKRKADDTDLEPAETTEQEVNTVFEEDESEDEKQYCICRGTDDGSFMISCERCSEWFHTKCIGITQKAAKKLDEYICEACTRKATDTGKAAPKPIKKYKSSKRQKAARGKRAQTNESASDTDEKEDNESAEEDSASDGDEYVGEPGDDASNHEDTVMQDISEQDHSSRLQQRKPSATAASLSKAKKDPSSSGSDSDKRKASESLRRASTSNKIATTSKKGAARKPTGPTDASTEEARSRARKVLASALEKIFVGHPGESKSAAEQDEDQDEQAETDAQRAETFAALLEEELFETNADTHGSLRVVGSKYKDRFRTFLFSLKDAKNTTLHSRIASGQLKPSELAKMSNEELANDAIRQATEKARLEALHRSTLRTDEAGPLRKMTHKGEIEIESDALVQRDQPGKFDRSVDATKGNDKPPATRVTESEPAISAPPNDDEDDSAGIASAVPKDDPGRRSAPAPGLANESPSRLNFGDVWTRSEEVKTHEQDDEPQESYGFGGGSPHHNDYDHGVTADADHDATGGADDFIDSFLDGPDEDPVNQAGGSGQSTSQDQARSTTPATEPPSSAVHRYRSIIWNGLIDLPDVFAFQGHVKQVAGRSLSSATRVWPKFFPERPLLIAGRLPTKAAVDYLLQVANAPKTEILAFTMEPGASKDGAVPSPQESDLAGFAGMLKHFKNADRWGALYISSSVKGSLIKDFYVVPLLRDEEVPLWLEMAESDCLGADWHTKRDRDLLVLVAVVIRDALQSELSRAERSPGRQRSVTNEEDRRRSAQAPAAQAAPTPTSEEAYDPSAGLSLPLGQPSTSLPAAVAGIAPAASAPFGSDALQSLLRTLGKTTAPPASSGAPAPFAGGLSPFGAAPPGPPPPGPPPGPPPVFPGASAPASASPIAGSWSPLPAHGAGAAEPQHWQYQQPQQPQQPPYPDYPHGYAGAPEPAPYGYGGGRGQEHSWPHHESLPPRPHNATPPQPQDLPEEEYPGQYNPDFLAQASRGGGGGYGGRGRGRGRGGWGRDRVW